MASRVVGSLTRRYQRPIVLSIAGLLLALFALVPLVAPFTELLWHGDDIPALLSSARMVRLLFRSLLLATSVTAISLAIGVPLGVLLGRMDVIGKRAAWILHAFPMFLPPFLLALGWFHLFGQKGLLGSEATAELLFGWSGTVIVLTLAFAPIATTLTALGLLSVDASLEEAARVVAGPWRVITRILLPSAWPAVALAAILIFALTLSELGVPMFFRVSVYPAAVFARLGGIDYAPGEALGLALPLLAIALALVLAERWTRRGRSFAVLGLRSDASSSPMSLGRLRIPLSVAAWAASALSVAPIMTLALKAALGGGFGELPRWIGNSPWNSLSVAMIAATLMTVLAIVIGHAAARGVRGAAVLDAVAVMVFVTPAPVLGIGLIAAYNRPWTQALYGSMGILVLGAMARYTAVGLRAVAVSVTQSSPQLEDAAAVSGAGFLRTLVQIVVPIHSRGLLAAWILTLVFVLRDLEMAVLYYPAGGEPLTVRIFTLEANGPEAAVAALAVTHVALTAAVVAAGAWSVAGRARWT